LRCGRVPLSEANNGVEPSEDSSGLTMIDGDAVTDGERVESSVGGISNPPRVEVGGVAGDSSNAIVPVSDEQRFEGRGIVARVIEHDLSGSGGLAHLFL
jgi:hypothetical protein